MKNRILAAVFKRRLQAPLGRILVLTGARQTGKTTLVRQLAPDYSYIDLDDPVVRPQYTALAAADWAARLPRAVLDEVQKTPAIFETLKVVHDRFPDTRYVLLGSSQILLLQKVRESLAGRAALLELLPLTLPELLTGAWDQPVGESCWVRWLRTREPLLPRLPPVLQADAEFARAAKALDFYLAFGGMPVLARDGLTDDDRHGWLRDYVRTYLQRDLRDLVNLRELEPFVLAQRALALGTGELLNASALAQHAGITPKTARRFLGYLELSYQVLLLQPWYRNPQKRLLRSPRIHFLDPGVQRAVLERRGALAPNEFSSAIVAELWKQLRTAGVAADAYHLQTFDGRAVDFLVELADGFVPVQVRPTPRVTETDVRHLFGLEEILDKPILHAFVLSLDPQARELAHGVTAVPAAAFLGNCHP